MESKEKQFEILELLANHELAIGSFYETCGNAFPEKDEFWKGIAKEEKIHALWIKNMKPKIEEELIYLNTERFTETSISTSIEFLKEELNKVKMDEYDELAALSTALEIENALIDSKNLELFSTDLAETKHFLEFLAEETKKHIGMIKERLEKATAEKEAIRQKLEEQKTE